MSNHDELMELIETTAGYSGTLYNGLERIVNYMREDNVKKGLEELSQAIEGVGWVTEAVSIAAGSPEIAQEFEIEPAKGFIAEMTEAAENLDYVLLADLIEYEILPILDDWGTTLDDILAEQNKHTQE